MIFDLGKDFSNVLAVMPREHPKHRMLELLEEAIRRDIHFIARHPTTLFQCMWNTCWWYDCPESPRPVFIFHRARLASHSGRRCAAEQTGCASATHRGLFISPVACPARPDLTFPLL